MLHFEISGTDEHLPWVVFIHGAGGSIQTWKYQRESVAKYANLLLIDLRDHGKSQGMTFRGDYNFDLVTADILEVLDHVGINEAIFVTLSFGSVLLQDLAMRSPGRIKAAVMAGAIFHANWKIRLFVHTARFMNTFLPYQTMYSLFSYLLMPRKEHQFSRRIYRIQAQKISPKAYMRWLGLYGEFFRLLHDFWYQTLPFPVMAVMGEYDYVFLGSARRFAGNRKNVMLHILPDSGHICNIDRPEAFNEHLSEYIGSLGLLANVPADPPAKT